mmetsp:Transcript_30254/g.96682  ORF Transcript_30254/g.96682 Transcript_30254/m.96682 type:complete len:206 (+) Transcript_30254:2844-3461(+)
MARMMECRPPNSPARVCSTISSTKSFKAFLAFSYLAFSRAWAPKNGMKRLRPYSLFAVMLKPVKPRPNRKLSTNGWDGRPWPMRSTLPMSKPMLQVTTASAVMAVSQWFTSVILWPAGKADHSRMKARVLARICGVKLFTLIWLKPRGRTLCADCQSSLVSLLVKRPLPVKSCSAFCAGRFHSLGNSPARARSSSAKVASADQVV